MQLTVHERVRSCNSIARDLRHATAAGDPAKLAPVSDDVLDNPAWHALVGPDSRHAEVHGHARRYERDVTVFSAIDAPTRGAWHDLAALSGSSAAVLIVPEVPEPPAPWGTELAMVGHQMWLPAEKNRAEPPPEIDARTAARETTRGLGPADVDELSALVHLTEPGPFRSRTIDLGGYVGIFHDGVLVAAAGQRMHPEGWCEISAVCTHPDARGRGYGAVVTAHVAAAIAARGEIPFLHVVASNTPAISVYERLGFTTRRMMWFCVLRVRRPSDSLTIEVDDPAGDDIRALLEQHLAFAHEHSPPEDVHALDVEALRRPGITFFSARRGGVLAGVGALKQLDAGWGEIKSMHTVSTERNLGIGRALLEHLLGEARARGYTRVSLETGTMDAFAPARALYAAAGFQVCAPFAEYRDSPNSVCMTLTFT
jgi:putative acetyltransferase